MVLDRGAGILRGIKQLTQSKSFYQAVGRIWGAGLAAYKQGTTLEELKAAKARSDKDSLEAARLVHDYETKILGIMRENEELKTLNKELERVYHILRRENGWLKDEIFKLKKQGQQ